MPGSDDYAGSAPPLGFNKADVKPTSNASQDSREANINNLTNKILQQNTYDKWTGQAFGSVYANAKHMATRMVDAGITRLEDFGQRQVGGEVFWKNGKSYVKGGTGTYEFYNKATGKKVAGDQQSHNILDITYAGDGSTQFNVTFNEMGMPVFYTSYNGSSSDWDAVAPILAFASIIPSPIQPFAMAINSAVAFDQGNIVGGVLGALGAAYSFGAQYNTLSPSSLEYVNSMDAASDAAAGVSSSSTIATAANWIAANAGTIRTAQQAVGLLNALDKKNLAGVIVGLQQIAPEVGVSIPESAVKPIQTAALVSAAKKGDWIGASMIGSSLLNSSDLALASKGGQVIKAVQSGNPVSMLESILDFNKTYKLVKAKDFQDAAKSLGMPMSAADATRLLNASDGNKELALYKASVDNAKKLYKEESGLDLPDDFFTLNASKDFLTKADDLYTTKEEARQLWEKELGYVPSEFDLMEIEGLATSDAKSVVDDKGTTTYDEAESFLKDLYGSRYTPTAEEVYELMGIKEIDAKRNATIQYNDWVKDKNEVTNDELTNFLKKAGLNEDALTDEQVLSLLKGNEFNVESYTQYLADVMATTYDAKDATSQADAQAKAQAAGYNAYIYDGKQYTFTPPATAAQIRAEIANNKDLTFSEAFAQARSRLGAGQTFEWNGKNYTTDFSDPNVFDASKSPSVTAAAQVAYANGKDKFIGPDGKTYTIPASAKSILDNVVNQTPAETQRLLSYELQAQNTTPSQVQAYTPPKSLVDDFKALASRTGEAVVDLTLGATNKGFGQFLQGVGNFATMLTVSTDPETGEVTWHVAKDNPITKLGNAYNEIGDRYISQTTKDQMKAIGEAVAAEKNPALKALTATYMGMTNPIALGTWAVSELTEEAPAMLMGYGLVKGAGLAIESGIAVNTAFNMAEVAGQPSMQAYDAAIKAGKSESEAVQDMLKVGAGSMAISLATNGVLDATIFKNVVSGVIAEPLVSTASSLAAKSYMAEYAEELGTAAWSGYVQNGEKLDEATWNNAVNQASVAALIGSHADVGMYLGPTAANKAVIIGQDVLGNDMTLGDLMGGKKLLNAETLDLNAEIGKAPDGDGISLGGYITESANNIDPSLYTNGITSELLNRDFVVAQDALGNNVTYRQLMDRATEENPYNNLYNELLNTTAKQRTEAQTDFLTTTLKNLGYDPKAADIKALISSAPAGSAAIAKAAATYADTHTVTYDEAKKMLTDAYTAQGFSKHVPTDAEIKQYMASGATVDPTAINKQIGTYVGSNTVTAAEAEQIFKDTYGYQPSKEEIAQFTAVINQDQQTKSIGEYVDPRQVTYEEAEQYLKDNGYQASEQDINQFVGQVNEKTQSENIASWVDPRVVDEQEVRAALEAAGFPDATDEMVQSLTGQYEEAKLQGMTKDALPGFIYQALQGQIGGLETGLETIGGQLTDLSADVKAKYDTLTQGQKDLADQLVQQGVDLNTAIETAVGSLQEDVNAKYETLTQGQKDIADQLVQQGVDLQTAIDTAIAGVQEDAQAKYDALTEGQKNLADQLTQQGVDLNNAIDIASQQNQEQIQELNKNLQEQIGTEGRTATQEDIDALTKMLAGQQDVNQQYDVNQDNQITQEDLDILTQIVSGQKTDWNAPAGSVWAPTGLRGQLYQSEQQRIADTAATQDAIKNASVANQRTALAGNAINQLGSLIKNLPGAYEAAQTTYQPVYAGEYGDYFNLSASPLDYGYSLSGSSQNKPQTTKIATGGYLDDLLKLLK